jgi:hypothetical protein
LGKGYLLLEFSTSCFLGSSVTLDNSDFSSSFLLQPNDRARTQRPIETKIFVDLPMANLLHWFFIYPFILFFMSMIKDY